MGLTAVLPSEGRCVADFYRPRSGLNTRTLGPMVITLSTSPPRATLGWIICKNSVHISKRDKGDEFSDDGGSMHLWNVGLLQQDCMVLYPRRLSSSYTSIVLTTWLTDWLTNKINAWYKKFLKKLTVNWLVQKFPFAESEDFSTNMLLNSVLNQFISDGMFSF
jgi:hypothetical protein